MPDTREAKTEDGPACNWSDSAEMSGSSRRARAVLGIGFLAIAGALASRQAPGRVALLPVALVPTWFGISHLVASVTGYRGCPELGAIPSVILARPVVTSCRPWEQIDRRLGASEAKSSQAGGC